MELTLNITFMSSELQKKRKSIVLKKVFEEMMTENY